MDILLLGSGGREDALTCDLGNRRAAASSSPGPAIPGIARWADLVDVDPCDPGAVVELGRNSGIDLVVVGPEAPLVGGVADALSGAGIAVFGPSAAAARLEGSKGFTKDLCRDERESDGRLCSGGDAPSDALAALGHFGIPVVIKADGLAAGKGVTVATSREEAESDDVRRCG